MATYFIKNVVLPFGIGMGVGFLPFLGDPNFSLETVLRYPLPPLMGCIGLLSRLAYISNEEIEKTDAIATPVFDKTNKFYQEDITDTLGDEQELCEEKDLPYKFQRC